MILINTPTEATSGTNEHYLIYRLKDDGTIRHQVFATHAEAHAELHRMVTEGLCNVDETIIRPHRIYHR
jgi:hypothetical protein